MQVKLIALCTEETRQNVLNNICPLVQQKLNACTIEVLNTIVFSDLYAINQNLFTYLDSPAVIIGDFENNIDVNLVKKVLKQRFDFEPSVFETGFYVASRNNHCLVIDVSKFNFYDYIKPDIICPIYNIPSPIAYLKIFGLDKINIYEKLGNVQNIQRFCVTVYVSNMEGELAICNMNGLPSFQCQDVVRGVYEEFNNYFLSDTDKPMLQTLDEILDVRNMKLCVADVLTQGFFEKFLKEGLPKFEDHIVEFDTLSTLEDIATELKVGADFLATHKKESVELCYEMGVSMMEHLDADVALVLSGNYKTPFIGVGDEQAIHVYKYNFDHSSQYITEIICRQAIFKIIKKLREN